MARILQSLVHLLSLMPTDPHLPNHSIALAPVLQALAFRLVHYQTDQNLQSHHYPNLILRSMVMIRQEFLQIHQSHQNLQKLLH